MSEPFDVVVVGGGHNGLVAAGPARDAAARVSPCSNGAPKVGGAAITEQPWGPDFKVTALSYVVSLMPPTIVRELELERHGYKVYPQHGYFVPYRDGRALQLPDDDPARRRTQIAQFSERRRRRVSSAGTHGSAGSPTCSARCSTTIPPARRLAPARRPRSTRRGSRGSCAGSACAASAT